MSAGKGSRPRPVNARKYAENYERIFSKRGIPVWNGIGKPGSVMRIPDDCKIIPRRTDQPHHQGEIVDGAESLGDGAFHLIDQHEPELRDDD